MPALRPSACCWAGSPGEFPRSRSRAGRPVPPPCQLQELDNERTCIPGQPGAGLWRHARLLPGHGKALEAPGQPAPARHRSASVQAAGDWPARPFPVCRQLGLARRHGAGRMVRADIGGRPGAADAAAIRTAAGALAAARRSLALWGTRPLLRPRRALACGKPYPHAQTTQCALVKLDAGAMDSADFTDDSQTDAGAVTLMLHAVEAREDVLALRRRDSRAIVFDFEYR